MTAGWRESTLGEVCTLLNGRAYTKQELLEGGKYPVLRVGNFFTNTHWYYSDLELAEDKYCDRDDLLYAWSASFGPRIWTGPKAIFHYHIWKVVPNADLIDKGFLHHFFLWDADLIKAEQGTGTTMLHVSKGSMEARGISLPTLEEQRRIVAILDEAFEGIATAKAHAEQNLRNAMEVFVQQREAVLAGDMSWAEAELSSLCEIKHGYAFEGEHFSTQGEHVLLTPGSFHEAGGFRERGDKTKYFTGHIPSAYVLDEGDLLVAMTEQAAGLLGSPLLVPESGRFLHNQRLGRVIAKSDVPWLNEFFFHAFNLRRVRKAIHDSGSGAKVRHTSPGKIGAVRVRYPQSIVEQQAIADGLVELNAECQRLVGIYQRKLTALTELQQSLLHQAFTGKL